MKHSRKNSKRSYKFTKEQYEAITDLKCMIDELRNKPRRLFSSLEKFAIAFLEPKSKHLYQVIDDIDEWEHQYYVNYNIPHTVKDVLEELREINKELTSEEKEYGWSDDQKEKQRENYLIRDGIRKAMREIGPRITKVIIDSDR